MAAKDGDNGNANIDLSEIQKGKTDGLAADLDSLDFGDTVVDDDGEKTAKAEKKTVKKAEKKEKEEKEEEKEAPAEEEDEEEEEEDEDGSDKEEEDEAEAEEDETAKKAEPKKEVKMVPQARLMHVKSQRDALEARLRAADQAIEELKRSSGDAKKAEAYEEKISAMYTQLETLRAASDVEGAAKLARELDKLKDEAGSRQAAQIAQIEARNQLEQRLYDSVVQQLELVAPSTNPESDEFDQDMVTALDAMTRGYEARGMSPSDALKQSATRLLGKDIFADKSIRREKQPEPKKIDVKKNTDAIKKTPPQSVREDRAEKNQELKPSSLSRDEFAKLPEATQRRLLGDEL